MNADLLGELIMEYKTCSFTGHRVILEKHKRSAYDLLLRAIGFAYEKGVRTFLAGGALGFDTLAAQAVISFRMSHPDARLVLVLPCKNQAEKWSESEVSAYEYTLTASDEIIYTADEYYDGCMKVRNAYLAENCDILIAYVGRKMSGAGQTLRMAEKLSKEIYNLYPTLEKGDAK